MPPASLARPLKSQASRPLAGFEPAAQLAQTRLWSPKSGSNVPPRSWSCWILPRAFRRVAFPLIAFCARRLISIRTEGLENLDTLAGPAIFAATHESKIDGVILLAALPGRWRYRMAIAIGDWVFWKGWFGGRWLQSRRYDWLVLLANVFTLPPSLAGLRGALRHVQRLANRGWSTLMFPEGMHTPWMLPFQSGAAWMAQHAGLPIVPVYIEGMGAVLPHDRRFAQRGSVCIRFGEPIPPGADFREVTARVEQAVHTLRERARPDVA